MSAWNSDKSKIEPLNVPRQAKAGEAVGVAGSKFMPDDEIDLETYDLIANNFKTDKNGNATFKGTPLLTSKGLKLTVNSLFGCSFA